MRIALRTKYSFINLVVSFGGQILTILLAFLGRLLFVHYLSAEELGVNGLFVNILGVLNLAELGIGTAMIYSLYKPVAEDDKERICMLMNLYKRLYQYVALVITVLGIALIPFLDYFIKGESGVDHLYLIYLMYLANVVASYLFSYKKSMLIANQKSYISVGYEQLFHVLQLFLQIIILILTQNFIFYLIVQLLCQFMVNVSIAVKVDYDYPFLKKNCQFPSKEERKEILKNIGAMSMHKFGIVIVNGTDNILMSAFVGLASVGVYSNYKLILTNINSLLLKANEAFLGSIGNLSAIEKPQKIYEIFSTLNFMFFLIYGYFAAGLAVLFNSFVELFFGKEYLFSQTVVLLIVIDFYLTGMRQMILLFRNAQGLFWYDRYKSLAEALLNFVVSVLLVKKYGVAGIFIGTIASNLLICVWVEPYVFMKYGIKEDWKEKLKTYFFKYGIRIVTVIIAGIVGEVVCSWISNDNIALFFLKGIVFSIGYFVIMIIFYRRSDEFIYLYKRVKQFYIK